MNILMVYQSVIDMCASLLLLLTTVISVDRARMSRTSIRDQFTCHAWHGKYPVWILFAASTYGILLMAFDRYAAVIHPVWYNNNVRTQLYMTSCRSRTSSKRSILAQIVFLEFN